jgi:hypothetical protein
MAENHNATSSFRDQLNDIARQSAYLKSQLNRSCVTIDDHCKELINQIDIVVETHIDELNALRRKYLAKIESYQEACLTNIARSGLAEKLISISEKANDFAQKWLLGDGEDNIEATRIALSDEASIRQTANQHLAQVTQLAENINTILFDGRLLKFRSKTSPSKNDDHNDNILGWLEIKNLRIPEEIEETLAITIGSSLSLSTSIHLLRFLLIFYFFNFRYFLKIYFISS